MPALAQDVLSSGRVTTVKPLDSFHRLVCDINRILGPSSGLNSNDVDPKDIEKLMDKYTSNESEWSQYAYADHTRAYTRNLVDHGNGKSNLLILVWTPGKGSPIHDHANAHCVMKILKGSLQETLYSWPDRDLVNDDKPSPLRIKKETTYRENQVTYMSDNLGLHKVVNTDPHHIAVSLHLYTPPNAAIGGCHLFDVETGKSCHISQCYFFSEHGKRCPSS